MSWLWTDLHPRYLPFSYALNWEGGERGGGRGGERGKKEGGEVFVNLFNPQRACTRGLQ